MDIGHISDHNVDGVGVVNRLPTPGSSQAIFDGCLCPIEENNQGQGEIGRSGVRMFKVVLDCPLHGYNQVVDESEDDNDL